MDKGKQEVPGQIPELPTQTLQKGIYSVTHVYGDKLVTNTIRPFPSDATLNPQQSNEDDWDWA